MDSLRQLNTYSNTSVSFTDLRPPRLVYDTLPPGDQKISILEGQTHSVPIGTNITEIGNSGACNITYEIELNKPTTIVGQTYEYEVTSIYEPSYYRGTAGAGRSPATTGDRWRINGKTFRELGLKFVQGNTYRFLFRLGQAQYGPESGPVNLSHPIPMVAEGSGPINFIIVDAAGNPVSGPEWIPWGIPSGNNFPKYTNGGAARFSTTPDTYVPADRATFDPYVPRLDGYGSVTPYDGNEISYYFREFPNNYVPGGSYEGGGWFVTEITPTYSTPSKLYLWCDGVASSKLADEYAFTVDKFEVNTNANISWPNLPSTITYSHPSANVYVLGNIVSMSDWNNIKSPLVDSSYSFSNNWSYTCTIHSDIDVDRSWDVLVLVTSLEELTYPSNFYFNSINDTPSITQISGTPTIQSLTVANSSSESYTLTISADTANVVTSLSTTGVSIGTATWDNTNKKLTITGNTLAVNSHLNNLYYSIPAALDASFNLKYSLYNPDLNRFSNVSQQLNAVSSIYWNYANAEYYDKNISHRLVSTPVVVDTVSNVLGTYTLTVSSNNQSNAISTLSSTGSGGTSNFYSGNLSLVVRGNKSQINSHLGNITMQPGLNYQENFVMKYSLLTPSNLRVERKQDFYINNVNTTVSNLVVQRYYQQNTPGRLFTNTAPSILETLSGDFTVVLDSTAGYFGLSNDVPTIPFVLSGPRSYVNSKFGSIYFFPKPDVIGQQSFTYTQKYNNVTETVQSVGITGNVYTGPLPFDGQVNAIYNSNLGSDNIQTGGFQFNYRFNYLKANVYIVGGGGANGVIQSTSPQRIVGGGGGQVIRLTGVRLSEMTNFNLPGTALTDYRSGYLVGQDGGNVSVTINGTLYTAAGGLGGNSQPQLSQIRGATGGGTGAQTGSNVLVQGSTFIIHPLTSNPTTYKPAPVYAGGNGAGYSGTTVIGLKTLAQRDYLDLVWAIHNAGFKSYTEAEHTEDINIAVEHPYRYYDQYGRPMINTMAFGEGGSSYNQGGLIFEWYKG